MLPNLKSRDTNSENKQTYKIEINKGKAERKNKNGKKKSDNK